MMNLEQLRGRKELIREIDWNMTPERAVAMYLEWGTGWKDHDDVVSSPNDESIYFVVYDWEKEPHATLLRRTLGGAEEIARIPVPEHLFESSWKEDGKRPGGTVHPPNRELKEWLCREIGGPPLDFSSTVN
ncbi:MAG: hypothetical protein Kow0089_16480 [Desulfobulbaceae bacterium]